MYWGNGMDGWGYVLMVLMMVLFWGLLITPADRSGLARVARQTVPQTGTKCQR